VFDFDLFAQPEGIDSDEYVIATYLLRSNEKDILKRVGSMAIEQTTGTWIKVYGETEDLTQKHRGKVLAVWEVPDFESDRKNEDHKRIHIFQIAYPFRNIGAQIPLLFTTVFGNISMMGDIKLLDLSLPKDFADGLPGPKFGISGVRDLLGVYERPLLNNMIKPSTGTTPEQGAELFHQAALEGTDIIKDDEVLGDTDFSPTLKRVELYMKKAEKVHKEIGHKVLYAVNVTDEPERCIKKAIAAVKNGANAIMVNYLPIGISILSSLARNSEIRAWGQGLGSHLE